MSIEAARIAAKQLLEALDVMHRRVTCVSPAGRGLTRDPQQAQARAHRY
jgi:hypothetical protein